MQGMTTKPLRPLGPEGKIGIIDTEGWLQFTRFPFNCSKSQQDRLETTIFLVTLVFCDSHPLHPGMVQMFPGCLNESSVQVLQSLQTRTTWMPAFWDTPDRPMITLYNSGSHQIPNQNKTKSKLQILKNCQKFKFWNIARNFTRDTPSEVAW